MVDTPHPSPATLGGPDQPRAPDVYGSDATEASIAGAPDLGVGAATAPPAQAGPKPAPETPGPVLEDADIAADDAGASARTETPQAKP